MAKAVKKVAKAKSTKKVAKPVAKKTKAKKDVTETKAKAKVKVVRSSGTRSLVVPETTRPVAVGDAPAPTRSRTLPAFVDTYGFSNLKETGEFITLPISVDRDLFISEDEYKTEFDSEMKSTLRAVSAKMRRYKKEFGGAFTVYKSGELVVVKRIG